MREVNHWEALQARRARQESIVLDGAMGAELGRRLGTSRLPWGLDGLVFAPATVRALHLDYLNAGARVLTTNAFRTDRRTLARLRVQGESGARDWGDLAQPLTHLATCLAKDARERFGEPGVAVAGNLTTLEDCFHPQRVPDLAEASAEQREKACWFEAAGADLILAETLTSLVELEAALEGARATALPLWVSLTPNGRGDLYHGEPIEEAIALVRRYEPNAVLLNCCLEGEVDALLPRLLDTFDVPIGVYPNLERPLEPGRPWRRPPDITTERFVNWCLDWRDAGAVLLGGCCGSTPADIAALAQALRRAA